MYSKYEAIYLRSIKNVNLFDSEIYGFACGYDPVPTRFALVVDSLIKSQNKKGIFDLISDPIPARMLFGLHGINELCKKGILLTDREKLIVRSAMNRDGKVQTCGGCSRDYDSIQAEVKEFNCLLEL